MNRGIQKEFRSLMPLWYVAAGLTVTLPLMGAMLPPNTVPLDFIPPVLLIAFCLVAAVVYTGEFEFDTLPLLMAQPVSRARIWARKFASVAAALSPLLLFYILLVPLTLISDVRTSMVRDWKVHSLVVVACAFAAGYWSLVGRNLIRAVALILGSLILWVSVADWTVTTVMQLSKSVAPPAYNWHIPVSIVVYATVFSWLGWRKFRTLELVEPLAPAESRSSERNSSPLPALPLTTKPAHARPKVLRAYLRKEARLHRLLLVFGSGLFLATWFLVAFTSHRNRENLVVALSTLAACYVILSAILAGSLSLSEEARLGVFEWHLTLPLSRGKLWFLKLLCALTTALIASVIIPASAGLLTAWHFSGSTEVLQGIREAWPLGVIVLELSLASFWAASFLRDTVRATVGLVVTLMLIAGIWAFCAWFFSESAGFQTIPLLWISAWRQVIPSQTHQDVGMVLKVVWMATIPLVLGWQSYRAMRDNMHGVRPFLGTAAWVLAFMLLLTAWSADLVRSSSHIFGQLQSGMTPAIVAFGKLPAANEQIRVTPRELERTGKLPALHRVWLRNSRITLQQQPVGKRALLLISVDYPNGTGGTFGIPWPDSPTESDLEFPSGAHK